MMIMTPSTQNTLGSQKAGFRADMAHRSSRLIKTAEAENCEQAWETHSRIDFNSRDWNHNPRGSTDSLRSENDHDIR